MVYKYKSNEINFMHIESNSNIIYETLTIKKKDFLNFQTNQTNQTIGSTRFHTS
jgi:hypothetical protein